MTETLWALSLTAISISSIHTMSGPDHYLPFIVLSRSRKWSAFKTYMLTIICGFGHILSSVVLGLIAVFLGWQMNKISWFQDIRGNISGWVTWILVAFVHHFIGTPPSEAFLSIPNLSNIDNFTSETNGFGEIIFQANIFAGILFFIGVYISSPIAAIYGLVGSAISSAISFHIHEPIVEIHMGLFSFNAVLCAIVFAGSKKTDGLLVLTSVIICVAINIVLVNSKIEFLQVIGGVFTLPFVLAACLVLPLKKRIEKNSYS